MKSPLPYFGFAVQVQALSLVTHSRSMADTRFVENDSLRRRAYSQTTKDRLPRFRANGPKGKEINQARRCSLGPARRALPRPRRSENHGADGCDHQDVGLRRV